MSRPIFNCIHCEEDCDWAGIERNLYTDDECKLNLVCVDDEEEELVDEICWF